MVPSCISWTVGKGGLNFDPCHFGLMGQKPYKNNVRNDRFFIATICFLVAESARVKGALELNRGSLFLESQLHSSAPLSSNPTVAGGVLVDFMTIKDILPSCLYVCVVTPCLSVFVHSSVHSKCKVAATLYEDVLRRVGFHTASGRSLRGTAVEAAVAQPFRGMTRLMRQSSSKTRWVEARGLMWWQPPMPMPGMAP